MYVEKARDHELTSIGKEFFDVTITPGDRVAVSLNKKAIDEYKQIAPESCGKFHTVDGWFEQAKRYVPVINRELQTFYNEYKKSVGA